MVGRLGPLHAEGQALGLRGHWAYRVVGLDQKATVLIDTYGLNAYFYHRQYEGTMSSGGGFQRG